MPLHLATYQKIPFSRTYQFGNKETTLVLTQELPSLEELRGNHSASGTLIICDENTKRYGELLVRGKRSPSNSPPRFSTTSEGLKKSAADDSENSLPPPSRETPALCVLPAGEAHKGWPTVESLLASASQAGMKRDGLFIGIGGGVITDLVAFAASIYMRGVEVRLVSTTLLGMVDAALGGKTGFDAFGIKNLIGSFYPASVVWVPLTTLETLPLREWKSGFAEIIKTGIIGDPEILSLIEETVPLWNSLFNPVSSQENLGRGSGGTLSPNPLSTNLDPLEEHTESHGDTSLNALPPPRSQAPELYELIGELILRSIEVKAKIVSEDPEERGGKRALLNLGHTFGHALEAILGLGAISHGEAVAWGIAQACRLGVVTGHTPQEKGRCIINLLDQLGYETAPLYNGTISWEHLVRPMGLDKKNQERGLRFIVPTEETCTILPLSFEAFVQLFPK
ncbi:MAG TPA: 3-dehydroquinate synthase family protein [Termitinemataceae bacterium]|nr:3-dehydroquinate synthase family protein [Termitinemataceae bacterium]HOM22477.1 3-dehydroquinate synthase family protein [Termitinemataceae bacterium]